MRIPTGVVSKLPCVGSAAQGVGIILDAKEIIDNSIPLGAVKILGSRVAKACVPPELYIRGKCVMLVGGVIATISTVGNPIVLSGTMSAFRSIIKDV